MQQRWLQWTRPRLPVQSLIFSRRHLDLGVGLRIQSRHFHVCASRLRNDHARSHFRKELKDAAKTSRTLPAAAKATKSPDILRDWELTVGIEIHAQLNASRKLFSPAITAPSIVPNSQIAPFDIALPGSLPVLQPAVILPALRAATALGCTIEPKSSFDRKHYFYHDQPAGYQITQYYHPFAKNGRVILTPEDGLDKGKTLTVNIKQVQLEQDTARTQEDDATTALIDFNRCGQALIEIISMPDLHSPRDAANYVRKVQSILYAVDAVTTGMEQGGLRADVNVSVRRRDSDAGPNAYGGVTGLGQRTEIKNLSTIKGIEEAIKAERDRQIWFLEHGKPIRAETRGWSITDPRKTRRLRSKEGEVDYRYMPDADIPPLYLSEDLIAWVKETLPPTATELVQMLVDEYNLTRADAVTLVSLDDGERLIYFQQVVDELVSLEFDTTRKDHGRIAGNWVLHELGALMTTEEREWNPSAVSFRQMASIINALKQNAITGASAKQILKLLFNGDRRSVRIIIEHENLHFSELAPEIYEAIAQEIIEKYPEEIKDIVEKGKVGKLQFLMGQMMKDPRSRDMRAPVAGRTLRRLILNESED